MNITTAEEIISFHLSVTGNTFFNTNGFQAWATTYRNEKLSVTDANTLLLALAQAGTTFEELATMNENVKNNRLFKMVDSCEEITVQCNKNMGWRYRKKIVKIVCLS